MDYNDYEIQQMLRRQAELERQRQLEAQRQAQTTITSSNSNEEPVNLPGGGYALPTPGQPPVPITVAKPITTTTTTPRPTVTINPEDIVEVPGVPPVIVKSGAAPSTTTKITLTEAETKTYSSLSAREQFEYLQKKGVIPKGAIFYLGDNGKWKYRIPVDIPENRETVKKVIAAKKVADERAEAIKVLEPYRIGRTQNYRLAEAIASENPTVLKAAMVAFTPADIVEAKGWIQEHWGINESSEIVKAVKQVWRDVTPWKEERGETVFTAIGNGAKGISDFITNSDPNKDFTKGAASEWEQVQIEWGKVGQKLADSNLVKTSAAMEKREFEVIGGSISKNADKTQQLKRELEELAEKAPELRDTIRNKWMPILSESTLATENANEVLEKYKDAPLQTETAKKMLEAVQTIQGIIEKRPGRLTEDDVDAIKKSINDFGEAVDEARPKASKEERELLDKEFANIKKQWSKLDERIGKAIIDTDTKTIALGAEATKEWDKVKKNIKRGDYSYLPEDMAVMPPGTYPKLEMDKGDVAKMGVVGVVGAGSTGGTAAPIIAALAVAGVVVASTKYQDINTAVNKANNDFTRTFKRDMTPDDVIVVGKNGQAFSLGEFKEIEVPPFPSNKIHVPQERLDTKHKDIEVPGFDNRAPDISVPGFDSRPVEPIKEGFDTTHDRISNIVEARTIVAVPTDVFKDTVIEYSAAETAAKKAERDLLAQWDKEISDAYKNVKRREEETYFRDLQRRVDLMKEGARKPKPRFGEAPDYGAIKGEVTFDKSAARINADIRRALREMGKGKRRYSDDAYKEYLRKKALLEDARKSFVQSGSPVPLWGDVTPEVISILATYAITKGHPKVKLAYQDAVQAAKSVKLATETQKLTAAQTALQKATATQKLTQTQVEVLAQAAVNQATATRVKTDTKTKTGTATKAKADVKTKVDTRVNTAEDTNVAENAHATDTDIDTEMEAEAEAELEITGGLKLKGGKKNETSDDIHNYTGAVGWKQGELNNKPVVHILKRPYKKQSDLETTVGKVPGGVAMAKGKGSARRSARLLHGTGPKNVTIDSGNMDVTISSQGRKVNLNFVADPGNQTHHVIRVGQPQPASNRGSGLRSVKRGKVYRTRLGKNTLLSRRPLGRKRR